jgi:hypothetical protein
MRPWICSICSTAGAVMIVQLVTPNLSLFAHRPAKLKPRWPGRCKSQGSFFPSIVLVVHSK